MKRFIKWLLIIVVIAIVGLLSYVKLTLPNVGEPENITIELTPERIERGKYLANAVSVCMDCHSTRDWSKFSAPLVEGTLGKGGEEFNQDFGFPGKFFSRNITPAKLKDWTDGEILRAISSGVNKDGKALFPVMPHPKYGQLYREDLYSIIAYLRTLEPIENEVPESEPDFPMNFIINTIPQKAQFSTMPDKADKVKYGEYVFTAAACSECHTKQDKGKPVEGMYLAGDFEFPMYTGGVVRSANITPDKKTGIGTWDEDFFVQRFKVYADKDYVPNTIKQGDFNTVMPWMMYANMTEEDLRAIYAYLQTVKSVENKVERFTE